MQDDKIQAAFALFDRDGSGKISASELRDILGAGRKLSNEDVWSDIIKEVDLNGDGEISLEEFKSMMC